MLSCKKIFLLLAGFTALCSCMEQRIVFDFNNHVNKEFFKELPGIGDANYLGQQVTKKAKNVEVYISTFSEKFIEKDHLLEFTELNDNTKIPFVTYVGIEGYSQDLYLLKYDFSYEVENKKTNKSFEVPAIGAVFFSVKHNGAGHTLGVMPCYFGIINEEDNLVAFDTELSLKKSEQQYFLKLHKKSIRSNGLLFMPANFPAKPTSNKDKVNIKKIVRLNANKVGGYKPLVFDIEKIFRHLNALQFRNASTLPLNKYLGYLKKRQQKLLPQKNPHQKKLTKKGV